jgi:selenide, water dikinase
LKDIGDGSIGKETPDCSVTPFYHDENINLVSTTDFFYPLVENPYLQGRIGCANVLSDIYAMGISRVDHMLMVLAVSMDMDAKEREVITREMIKGFNDTAAEAGTKITGGQSILNPWPIIGGIANTVVRKGRSFDLSFR